ncbi:hypothetical protein [Pseudomonas sp. Xaverov 259]|uniref:hypothetical protein n=1 Tax=Pseudomonas sp. Xaverov 259 TaxID=2666086 RepID=UPI001C5BF8C6|nr:hypothetical protein [Pseudomonas sp. Xaverov 259]
MSSPIGGGNSGGSISSEALQGELNKELKERNKNTLEMAKIETQVTKANKWSQVLNKVQ